ncbi:type IV secretion system protein B4 [Brucella sp. NBRC 12950]|uniref:VirB4 family type IV secretion system protein n=1 Tax=Brucella sp. NBRC 12950 TaxID=2994518 RepID=UPI0024A115D8|nr:type IV secretion system protein B4 [Brucella sp. NBRC 12950]GLU27328.1 type VI secretion protein [Brucella sp. NBRC 12950]
MNHKFKLASRGFRDLYFSSAGKRIFPRAMAHEEQFEDYLPYAFLLADDVTLQTKERKFIQCIRLDGINSSSSSNATIDGLKKLFASVVANSDEQFSYYVHSISKNIKYAPTEIRGNQFARELDDKWLSHLMRKGHKDTSITISVISSSSLLMKFGGLAESIRSLRGDQALPNRYDAHHADSRERITRLGELTALICSAFAAQNARVLNGKSGELIGYLESIGCGIETRAYPLEECAILSRSIANYRPTQNGTIILISGGSVSNRIGRIFTIKDYPRSSYAGIFDDLKLPLDFVLTNSFVPVADESAKELFRRTLAQRVSVNDAAVTDQHQMAQGRDRIASGLERLGSHHMTIAIYAETGDEIEKASAEIRAAAQEAGAKVVTEAFAGMGHYFAQWPGNEHFRARTRLVTNQVFAGMAAFHRTPTGLDGHNLPWRAPITAFPTPGNGIYKFSFHPKSSPDAEPPAAHTAMFGDMGSGKTVLINFLTAQSRRLGVQTFLFDYRQGMETAIKALSGSYTKISPELPTGLNPLYGQTDPEGQAWLTDWLIALFDRDDKRFTALQRQAISDAVSGNAKAPDHLRNFRNFPDLFAHIDDDGELQQRIREWCTDGRYGWVFGENSVEEFSLNNPVMGFDMTTVLDSGHEKEKTAILGYLFRLIERKLQDKQPTLIVIDEAWSALNTDYFARKLQNWLVTARKLNAVVMLVTQFPSQISESRLGPSMFQAIRTHIVLPNRNADASNYDAIRLNERELQTVLNSPAGTRMALIRNDTESIAVNTDLTCLGEHLSILGGGPSGQKAFQEYISRGSHD